MKLTKGKLSKLFNKKKQSHKKKKNHKKNKKSNTFRRNKRSNLANKTLKKIKIGGGDEGASINSDEIVPSVVQDDSDSITPTSKITEAPSDLVETSDDVESGNPPSELVETSGDVESGNPPSDLVETSGDVESGNPPSDLVETSGDTTNNDENTDDYDTEQDDDDDENFWKTESELSANNQVTSVANETTQPITHVADDDADSVSESNDEDDNDDKFWKSESELNKINKNKLFSNININKETPEQTDQKVASVLADYLGTKYSNASGTQNGFDSVNNVSNIMGASTAGGKHKTKKKRLTKKQKTRRAK
jgi:hypothetical protein